MSAELPRGAALESSAFRALAGGSRAVQDMQMTGGSERELAGFLPSISTRDLTVVAAGADDAPHHAVI